MECAHCTNEEIMLLLPRCANDSDIDNDNDSQQLAASRTFYGRSVCSCFCWQNHIAAYTITSYNPAVGWIESICIAQLIHSIVLQLEKSCWWSMTSHEFYLWFDLQSNDERYSIPTDSSVRQYVRMSPTLHFIALVIIIWTIAIQTGRHLYTRNRLCICIHNVMSANIQPSNVHVCIHGRHQALHKKCNNTNIYFRRTQRVTRATNANADECVGWFLGDTEMTTSNVALPPSIIAMRTHRHIS